MSYLIYNDYKRSIQALNLQQVLGNDLSILESWQVTAQEEAISRLTQKYDVSAEFTDTTVWDISKIYYGADRIYLDAPAYSATTGAIPDDLVLIPGVTQYLPAFVYKCDTIATGAFDPSKFTLLGKQYEIFYALYPDPLFNINNFYKKGDSVFWKDFRYLAISNSPGNCDSIQYGTYENVPKGNYFPGQPNSSNQWGAGLIYAVPAGTLPTDTEFWIKGDNRGQQLVQKVTDIVIFYIHQRISPQNIPLTRVENYKMAIRWLIDAGIGEVTPNLPLRQPNQGNRIRYGGNIRLNNHY